MRVTGLVEIVKRIFVREGRNLPWDTSLGHFLAVEEV